MLNRQAEKAIEKYLPKMQKIFREKLGPKVLEAAKNDKAMEKLFITLYKRAVPFPARPFVIKKDAFVKFCFTHRDQFV